MARKAKRKAVKRRAKRGTAVPPTTAFWLHGNHDGTATAWTKRIDEKRLGDGAGARYLFFLHTDEQGRFAPKIEPGGWVRVKLVKTVRKNGRA